jgi:hypothetical protein
VNSGLTNFTSGASDTAGLAAGLAWPDDDDAVAERAAEAAGERVTEAVAIGKQHHHRHDAPGNAEHRQQRTGPIARQASEGLSHDLRENVHSASVWGSSYVS